MMIIELDGQKAKVVDIRDSDWNVISPDPAAGLWDVELKFPNGYNVILTVENVYNKAEPFKEAVQRAYLRRCEEEQAKAYKELHLRQAQEQRAWRLREIRQIAEIGEGEKR